MKTLYRTLIILCFAAIVAGATYWIGISAWGQQITSSVMPFPGGEFDRRGFQSSEGMEFPEGFQRPEGFDRGNLPAGFEGRMPGGTRGGTSSGFAAVGFLKTLIPITVIIFVVVLLQKAFELFVKKKSTYS